MDKQLYDLKVDPELERMTRPLTETEDQNLTEDIIEHSCLSPVIVWNGVIVDGHNRYRICHEHNIPFGIEQISFGDKAEAKMWIYRNQIARRNVTKFERCEMVLEMEPDLKAETEERRRELISWYRTNGETAPNWAESTDTRDILAGMAGVGHNMIDRVRLIVSKADEPTKEMLRNEELTVNSVYTRLREKSEKKNKSKEETEEGIPCEEISDTPLPCSYIDHPTEDPVTHREPEREQGSYEFVKDQVEFAIRNMIADMKVGIYCLSNEDFDKKKELKAILREGYKQAADIIDRLEKM